MQDYIPIRVVLSLCLLTTPYVVCVCEAVYLSHYHKHVHLHWAYTQYHRSKCILALCWYSADDTNWIPQYNICGLATCMHIIRFRNVPDSKWQLLSIVLARVGKTGETAANWNNSRPWIGLFQSAKCDNVPKCNLEFAWGKSVVVAVTLFSLFHIILFLIILPTKFFARF